MKNEYARYLILAAAVAFILSSKSAGISYREWELDRTPYRGNTAPPKTMDVSSYRAQISVFEDKLIKLKARRDRLPKDTAQYIDLDQAVKELSSKIRIANREVKELEVAGPSVRDTLQSTVNLEIAQIQAGFDSMQAE